MPHEGATILPGVFALFGFQLLIVFSSAFQDGLDRTEQRVHLIAIALVALAIAALLTPAAAFLRRVDPSGMSTAGNRVTRRSLVAALLSLAIAIPLEVFLAACVILRGQLAIALGIVALVLFFALWFVIPLARNR
jgi:uncharacterized protein DUF6328